MQDRFAARAVRRSARTMGIHTAIETNGYFGERLSDEELETIDLVILDMKAVGSGAAQASSPAWRWRPDVLEFATPAGGAASGRCGCATCWCRG